MMEPMRRLIRGSEFNFSPCPQSNLDGSVSVDTLLQPSNPMDTTKPQFLRRIGPDPHANGAKTIAAQNCPDVWELADGNFAVIGIDITDACIHHLPPSAGCGPDERVVLVQRRILVDARNEIPEV